MKRLLSVALIMIMVAMCTITSFAIVEKDEIEVIYFEDGSYLEIVVVEPDKSFSTYATQTKTGDKVLSYKDSNGELKWKVTVTGTFTYTGSSSTCTTSSISYNVYAENWEIIETTASKSSNKAIGNVTAKRYLLGLPVQTVTETITLSCSATGVLS